MESICKEYLACLFLLLADDKKFQARHDGAEQQLPVLEAGVPGQRPGIQTAHDQLRLFERWQANKHGETTGAGATHVRGVCGKG